MTTSRHLFTLQRVLAVVILLGGARQVHAVVNINAVDGTIRPVPKINTFETWGGPPQAFNMEGMEVTAVFQSGASETATWTGTIPNGGAAIGTNWQLENLTQVTHTFGSPWTLKYSGGPEGNLIGFKIDGFAEFFNTGNPTDAVAFDRTLPSPGTLDSESGRDFDPIGVGPFNIDVTYSDAVDSLADGPGPQRDLYRFLDVRFNERIVPKWQQLPEQEVGENLHSDIDWRRSMETPDRQAVADDFISDGRPITAVRWWGSYFNPEDAPQQDADSLAYLPQVEDGFLISFFEDNVAGAAVPGDLAGSYIAPAESVKVSPTGMVGWDGHPVWQYEVELTDTFLDHAGQLATKESFNEVADTEYWISIAAEDGHRIDPDTGEAEDTGDPVRDEPFWGWHTSPEHVVHDLFGDDAPVASNVFMPDGEWEYLQWGVVPQQHADPFNNMAFELLTIDSDNFGLDGVLTTEFSFNQDTDIAQAVPEPTAAALLMLGLMGAAVAYRQNRSRSC